MSAAEGVYHDGETAVQERAGVLAEAAKLGPRVVRDQLTDQFADFLRRQRIVIVASGTPSGRVWASALTGAPGFAVATAPDHVVVRADIARDDPLTKALEHGPTGIGLLVIDPVTRSRIRINGIGQRTPRGLEIDLTEVFGNCPKYIQRRVPTGIVNRGRIVSGRSGTRLDADQRSLIEASDTLFIASRHPNRGADASHRGGSPGFIAAAADGGQLTFPDYAGNNMFQTLGNLTANPATGLLFIDWETGRILQISGRAEIIWDEQRVKSWPRAQRLVDVHIAAVIDRSHESTFRWKLLERHRLNPPAPTALG
jgi:uncharacterized protein